MFLFLIMINFAGIPSQDIEREIGKTITQNRRKPVRKLHLKYVDDLSYLTSINLKKKLIENSDPYPPLPPSYHNRTSHTLPREENILQDEMEKLTAFANYDETQINCKKTKVMIFNTRRKFDFHPEIKSETGDTLDVEEEFKLLGVKITSDMKWHTNTKFICCKGYARLWMLRNLKKLGAGLGDLMDVYKKQCRSVLEMAVPAWSAGLTKTESNQIERVQRSAFAIILGDEYGSYSQALRALKMETLVVRREALCLKFAQKAFNSEKFKNWFVVSESPDDDKFLFEVKTRTSRYRNSPLPYLTKLF